MPQTGQHTLRTYTAVRRCTPPRVRSPSSLRRLLQGSGGPAPEGYYLAQTNLRPSQLMNISGARAPRPRVIPLPEVTQSRDSYSGGNLRNSKTSGVQLRKDTNEAMHQFEPERRMASGNPNPVTHSTITRYITNKRIQSTKQSQAITIKWSI